jgi:hypothetical protein
MTGGVEPVNGDLESKHLRGDLQCAGLRAGREGSVGLAVRHDQERRHGATEVQGDEGVIAITGR